jgi:hypothetical protein
MTSSGRIRLLVFSLFFVALIAFAILYSPTNALSRPAQQGDSAVMPTGTPLKIKAPLGLPPVPIPAADPPTTETVALGRGLYYDPLFSGDTRSRVHPVILRKRVYRHSPSLDSAKNGRGTRRPSSTPPIALCNSGMDARLVSRNRRSGQLKTQWRWRRRTLLS